jgi:hypothetical protein
MFGFPDRKLIGRNRMLFVTPAMPSLHLLKAVSHKRFAKRLSREGGTACTQLPCNTVNRFDKVVVKGHLNRSHITPQKCG